MLLWAHLAQALLLLAGQGQQLLRSLILLKGQQWETREGSSLLPCVQVRSWDVETGVQRDALNSSKAVYAVDTAPGTASVVALAGADKAWRLWDMRQRRGEGLVSPTSLHCASVRSRGQRVLLACAAPRRRGSRPTPATRTGLLALPGAPPQQLIWQLSPMTRPASCGTPAASFHCTRWRATLIRCVSSCCLHK